MYGLDTSARLCALCKKSREFCNQFPGKIPGKMYKKINARNGQKVSLKMEKAITILKGKAIREQAQRLVTGTFRIEKENLNRYAVYEGAEAPDQVPAMYLNRVCFIRLDSEIYKIQSRQNPLAYAIEKALDNDALTFSIEKALVDKMPVKLLVKTLSSAKVTLESVTINATGNNYLLTIALIKAISERDLTQKELEIAEIFIKANENAAAGNPETETPAPPAPETDCNAKVIPAK